MLYKGIFYLRKMYYTDVTYIIPYMSIFHFGNKSIVSQMIVAVTFSPYFACFSGFTGWRCTIWESCCWRWWIRGRFWKSYWGYFRCCLWPYWQNEWSMYAIYSELLILSNVRAMGNLLGSPCWVHFFIALPYRKLLKLKNGISSKTKEWWPVVTAYNRFGTTLGLFY